MHDPMTQIYSNRFFILWHVDPVEDSCGWFGPNLTKEQRSRLDCIASDEARSPWFQRFNEKEIPFGAEAESLLRGAILLVARCFRIKVSVDEATEWSIDLIHNSADNIRNMLAFKPGYHSNSDKDRKSDREDHAKDLFCCLGRFILRKKRPWYRHPKWHFWHWKLQIHAVLKFKRWAWSRCYQCGVRFKWGECPIRHQWDGTGPQWFKSERGVYHRDCIQIGIKAVGV